MAPIAYQTTKLTGVSDKEALTFLHHSALHMIAESILLSLHGAAILLYLCHSLVVHFSLKFRGLAEDRL
jgi:hypothetical protein